MVKNLLIVSLNGDPLASLGSMHAGGQCKYVLELSKNLTLMGWKIDVITIKNSNELSETILTENFGVYRFALSSNQDYSYSVSKEEIMELSSRVYNWIKKSQKNYGLILSCYWLSGITCEFISKKESLRWLMSYCSLGVFKAKVNPQKAIKFRLKEEKRLGQSADAIIAATKVEREAIIKYYGIKKSKIHVIPRGINLEIFNDG